MPVGQPQARDFVMMDAVLREARNSLAEGSAGVAADEIIALARNTIQETGDLTQHAEMVLLHRVGSQIQTMDDRHRRALTLYVTLEPCLMCSVALSFVGIKRIVYAALAEDANDDQMIVPAED